MRRSLFIAATASAAAVAALPVPAPAIADALPVPVAAPTIWRVADSAWYVARSEAEALELHVERMIELSDWAIVDGQLVEGPDDEPIDRARITVRQEMGAIVKREDGTPVRCMEMYYEWPVQRPDFTVRWSEDDAVAYVPFDEMIAENGIGHLCDEV